MSQRWAIRFQQRSRCSALKAVGDGQFYKQQRPQGSKWSPSEARMSKVYPPSGLWFRLSCVDVSLFPDGFCLIHAGPRPAKETKIWPLPIDPSDHRLFQLLLEQWQHWDSAAARKQQQSHNHCILLHHVLSKQIHMSVQPSIILSA